MALTVEDGFNLQIELEDIVFGCATTIKFGASVEDKDATCTASQGTKESRPGQKSYTLTADALMRVDSAPTVPATNITSNTIEKYFEDRTIFNWSFTTTTSGGTKKSGTAYIKSFEEGGGSNTDATLSVTFTVTGPVTYTPVA